MARTQLKSDSRETGTVRRIVLLATLDTKGDEAAFVANCIRQHGHQPWIIDLGLRGTALFPGDTPREAVAERAGHTWDSFTKLSRADAMAVGSAAATAIVKEMIDKGEAHAIIGIGGGSGTWLATNVMRQLPIGFPKLMVSTIGSRYGAADIAIMPSIADIAGVNSLLAPILANASAAISGMARGIEVQVDRSRPAIGMTMFGVTTTGGTFVRRFLEEQGCEVIVFHANGSGGATMEELTRKGRFAGIIDWTLSEITAEVVGRGGTAGPTRLEAAGECAVPQLIVPGAVDVIIPGSPLPKKFAKRAFHMHTPTVRLVRTSEHEARAIGIWVARKLNRARAPVRVLIPEGGYSAVDAPGQPFHDPVANAAFVRGLRKELRADIPVEILPYHINDEAFARAAADALLEMGVVSALAKQ